MKKFWAQLKPQERRWVTGIGILVFVILNYFMVWPKFHEWGKNRDRMKAANDNIAKYNVELRRKADYERKIAMIQKLDVAVPLEDQVLAFERFCRDRATENGVQIPFYGRPNIRTNNPYFIEQEVSIQVQATEKNLVEFLYSLGSSNSMMRVRSMNLHPVEPTRYVLDATLTIAASYQKKNPNPAPAPVKPAPAPVVAKTAPAVKPDARPNAAPTPGRPPMQTNRPGTPNTKRL